MTCSACLLPLTCGVILLVACGSTSRNPAGTPDGTGTDGAQNGTGGTSATATTAARGGTGGTANPAVDPDRRTACEALGAARCQQLEACQPIWFAAEYPERTICEGLEARTCVESVDTTNPSASELTNCAAEIANQSCGEWDTARVEGVQESTPSCALFGDLEALESCSEDWQCASGLCRNLCYDVVGEGESCQGSAACASGLRCVAIPSDDGVSNVCRPTLQEGEACEDEITSCIYPFACVDGACAEPVMGASCNWNTFNCGEMWGIGYCHANPGGEGVCVETNLVGVGEECGQDAVCDATSYCSPPDTSVFGTCLARPKVGESCEQQFNTRRPVCEAGAECQGDVCVWVL